jgi:hypothetical protein
MDVRVVGLATMRRLNAQSIGLDYNRNIEPEYLKTFRKDASFEVKPCMVHAHACGEPVAHHLRCYVHCQDGLIGFLDMPFEAYDKLPSPVVPVQV